MVEQRLVNFIKSGLSRGNSLDQIKQGLLEQGWPDSDIEEAIGLAQRQAAKKSSKKILLIPIIVIIILIAGIFTFFMFGRQEIIKPAEGAAGPSGSTDCGTNMDCFITASQDCKPSKVTNTIITDLFGVNQTTVSYHEIRGLEEGKCIFYLRTEKIDLVFPPAIPQEIIDQQKEAYKSLEGREGTCKFNTDDLTSMLNRWKSGALSTEDWDVAECGGDYFNQEL